MKSMSKKWSKRKSKIMIRMDDPFPNLTLHLALTLLPNLTLHPTLTHLATPIPLRGSTIETATAIDTVFRKIYPPSVTKSVSAEALAFDVPDRHRYFGGPVRPVARPVDRADPGRGDALAARLVEPPLLDRPRGNGAGRRFRFARSLDMEGTADRGRNSARHCGRRAGTCARARHHVPGGGIRGGLSRTTHVSRLAAAGHLLSDRGA